MLTKIINKYYKKIKKSDRQLNEELGDIFYIKLYLNKFFRIIFGFFNSLGTKGYKFNSMGLHSCLKNKKYIKFEGKCNIGRYVEIDGISEKGIIFGKNNKIGNFSIIRGSSNYKRLGKGIITGDNFSCGDFTFFGAGGGIKIGNDVIMGQFVRFHAQNHYYSDESQLIRNQGVYSKGIIIGNNCWIGDGTIFLDGVVVGDGCVIGANTVVTKSIPPNSVVVGQPGRILKSRINK